MGDKGEMIHRRPSTSFLGVSSIFGLLRYYKGLCFCRVFAVPLAFLGGNDSFRLHARKHATAGKRCGGMEIKKEVQ